MFNIAETAPSVGRLSGEVLSRPLSLLLGRRRLSRVRIQFQRLQWATDRKIDAAVIDDYRNQRLAMLRRLDLLDNAGGHAPLILYSPLSWLLLLRTLSTEEAFEPWVSIRSKPGASGRRESSVAVTWPRRVNGLRIGMMVAYRLG